MDSHSLRYRVELELENLPQNSLTIQTEWHLLVILLSLPHDKNFPTIHCARRSAHCPDHASNPGHGPDTKGKQNSCELPLPIPVTVHQPQAKPQQFLQQLITPTTAWERPLWHTIQLQQELF